MANSGRRASGQRRRPRFRWMADREVPGVSCKAGQRFHIECNAMAMGRSVLCVSAGNCAGVVRSFGGESTISSVEAETRVEFPRYVIFGACSPPLAGAPEEIDLGLLLPRDTVVYERDGRVYAGAVDAAKMFSVAGNPAMEPMARQVDQRLRRVLDGVNAPRRDGPVYRPPRCSTSGSDLSLWRRDSTLHDLDIQVSIPNLGSIQRCKIIYAANSMSTQ